MKGATIISIWLKIEFEVNKCNLQSEIDNKGSLG